MRPPGAQPTEQDFLATCSASEGCKACIDACPYHALHGLGPEWGKAESTPAFIDLAANPCRWCQDMPCIQSCESGALAQDRLTQIASISLDLDACLNLQGTLCSDCSDFCPPTVRAMTTRGRMPLFNPERCVGCGLCAWHCDAPGEAIKITPNTPPS